MSQPTAHELNAAARFEPATEPGETPALVVAGIPVHVYVYENDDKTLTFRISAHFDGSPGELDPRLINSFYDEVRTEISFNGEPQDTYDRSTGVQTTGRDI